MTLPKLDYPIHMFKIPSTKKNTKFRPFLVKEEKLLLMAKESDSPSDHLSAIKQIVNNCCLEKNIDINKFTTFDLEYIFLKLRGVSVDNIVKVSYIDHEDNLTYNFEIDINTIEIKEPEKISNDIKLSKDTGIIMKYPSASLYDDTEYLNNSKEPLFDLIIKCIDTIYQKDTIYKASEYSKEELSEFLEVLDVKSFEKINEFLTNMPKLYYRIEYENSKQTKRIIELTTLTDFFM